MSENKAIPNTNKGKELEAKVAKLLKAVFEHDPKLKQSDFDIRLNETVIVKGVPYQIDVWVETQKSSPYKAIFVYECKNWSSPIGKAEVAALAKTVDTLGATRGFLVAREYSKHARTLVESETKIQLLECPDDFSNLLKIEGNHITHEPIKLSISLSSVYEQFNFDGEKDLRESICRYNGQEMTFDSFQNIFMRDFFTRHQRESPVPYGHVGMHYDSFECGLPYWDGQLLINGIAIHQLRVQAKFFIYIRPLRLVSKFELTGVGRTCCLAYQDEISPEVNYQIEFLMRG